MISSSKRARRAHLLVLVGVVGLVGMLLPSSTAQEYTGANDRVSVSSSEAQADSASTTLTFQGQHVISGGGRHVAFTSSATNLVNNDTNTVSDVFVRDRLLGLTTRVSVTSNGTQSTDASGLGSVNATISPNGRFVGFESGSSDLTTGDSNGFVDAFVHDRSDGKTFLVSLATSGAQGDSGSFNAAVSNDGVLVAFESAATNFESPSNGINDIFVRNRATNTTTLVSANAGGAPGGGSNPSISADGRFIAFDSPNSLITADTNGLNDVYVRDLSTGSTRLVSTPSSGAAATTGTGSLFASISPEGRFVAFESDASDLVNGDSNALTDVFVKDLSTGAIVRVSLTDADAQVTTGTGCVNASTSSGGRFTTFECDAALASDDTNGTVDVFVRDRIAGTTQRASAASIPNGTSVNGGVSPLGEAIAYDSTATNLVSGDTNGAVDVFTRAKRQVGYWMTASDGGIFTFGPLGFFGSAATIPLARPIVDMAATPSGQGYWLVASDGGVFAFGDAGFFGSAAPFNPVRPIVAILPTPSGQGYWLVAADGGLFAFGDAGFFGSAATIALRQPIVGGTSTPTGLGYFMVAADGGLFAFGDASFQGSAAPFGLVQPAVGMEMTGTGLGYWIVARDGGIFAFGDAPFFGSTGGMPLNQPVVSMTKTPLGDGYNLYAGDGGVFAFGAGPFAGSAATIALRQPIVGSAAGLG